MGTNNQQWHASRIIHLQGGMRAINIEGPEVCIAPNTLHGRIAQFTTSSYGAVYADLEKLGFSVLGVDFYTHISEVKGESPPNWRVFNRSPNTVWPSEETARTWKGIAHSAFQLKLGHIWDLASRIGHQLRVCSWRIRQLSEAYNQQLAVKSTKNEVEPGQRYEDGFTWSTYLAVQSYLVDACILRDYLSEFAAVFVFGKRYGIETKNISSIAGLLKMVLNREVVCDSLAEDLRKDTANGGWLKILGEYRDLVVHSAPLAHAEMRLYAVTDALQIDAEGAVPFITIPLPDNPADISAERASRRHFEEFEEQFKKYIESVSKGHSTIDALAYITQTHGNLSKLAIKLSEESPVPYQDIVLTEQDIIGPIQVITK